MLTDERILSIANMVNLKMRVRVDDLDLVEFARAVESEAREDADECIRQQEDLLRELRAERDAALEARDKAEHETGRAYAERDALRALLREWLDINDGEKGGDSWASLIDRTDAALAAKERT